jgi:hypothetical protein
MGSSGNQTQPTTPDQLQIKTHNLHSTRSAPDQNPQPPHTHKTHYKPTKNRRASKNLVEIDHKKCTANPSKNHCKPTKNHHKPIANPPQTHHKPIANPLQTHPKTHYKPTKSRHASKN